MTDKTEVEGKADAGPETDHTRREGWYRYHSNSSAACQGLPITV